MKKRLTAARRTCLHRARERSITRTLDDEDRTALPSTIGLSVGNCPSLDREAARALLVEPSRIDHVITNEVAQE